MIYALLIIVAIIATAIYFLTRKSPLERRARKAIRKVMPSGVTVLYEEGEPYPNVLAVEQTVIDFIEEAYDKGYRLNRGGVQIAFLKPDGVSEDGIPVFEIKSTAYENSVYNIGDGKIKIGGIFFSPDLVVLPTQRDDAEMRNVLRHELIHFAHKSKSEALYNAHKVHYEGEVFEL